MKAWSDEIGSVENALVDDDVRDALASIRARGAFVWLVFDSCHSGTMSRSAATGGDSVRMRDVKPNTLQIPAAAMQRAYQSVRSRGAGGTAGNDLSSDGIPVADDEGAGGFVAFYAARTTETTPEMMLPRYHPESEPHGLFTHTLIKTLSRFPGATYRQVIQQVLQDYSAMQWRATTPLYEGTALDAPVFGAESKQGVTQQWRFERKGKRLTLYAGTLHEVTKGSVLAVATSAAADDEVIGYVTVTRSGMLTSEIEVTAHADNAAIAIKSMPKRGYARLVESKTDFTLRVAYPADDQLKSVVGKRISEILFGDNKLITGSALVEWVAAGQQADLRLAVESDEKGSLWLLPPTAELEPEWRSTYSKIRLDGRDNAKVVSLLMDSLSRIAKVRNLMRLANRGGDAANTELGMSVERADSGEREDIALGTVPNFYNGDSLELTIRNTRRSAQDVTVLFIGADYSIQTLFPYDGEINRVEAGSELVIDGIEIDASETVGREQLIVIATQARADSPLENFGFLAQAGVPKDRDTSAERGGDRSVHDLLKSAGFGVGTSRGAGRKSRATADKLSILTVDWKTRRDP